MRDPGGGKRYPGYDVLSKRDTPSWNQQTREVVDARLAIPAVESFFTADEFRTVEALAARLVPQPSDRPAVPVAALVDHKLQKGRGDGYRQEGMPREQEAWRRGLAALDVESNGRHGSPFAALTPATQDVLLHDMQAGKLTGPAWQGMPSDIFFKQRMAHDVVLAYYAHPTSWNEVGWGGPASPRGYVRMGANKRDPWEAAEVKDGDVAAARRKNQRVG